MHLSLINSRQGINVKDVPAKLFIAAFAAYLKKGNKFKIPDWAGYVKTACFKELAPYESDWLYTRAASVAYQLYIRGKVGVGALRTHYGKKERRGTVSNRHRQAAGKVIRYCLKQLEDIGYVGTVKY